MPAQANQVMDSVRHSVENGIQVKGEGDGPLFSPRGDDKAWIPASTGMTKKRKSTSSRRRQNPSASSQDWLIRLATLLCLAELGIKSVR